MNLEQARPRSLREMEMEVEAEGREWTRQRLQQPLQEAADRHGEVFPLSGRRLVHGRRRRMQLRTVVGTLELQVLHGQDPADKHWGCPVREPWGLSAHQQLSLALEDQLAFTITATASYAEAAANGAMAEIARLKVPPGAAGQVVQREENYFATHAGRMNYETIHRRGWAIGSGPVESACRQRQCRFKRLGQFWTAKGRRQLGALTEARHNHPWDELWPAC